MTFIQKLFTPITESQNKSTNAVLEEIKDATNALLKDIRASTSSVIEHLQSNNTQSSQINKDIFSYQYAEKRLDDEFNRNQLLGEKAKSFLTIGLSCLTVILSIFTWCITTLLSSEKTAELLNLPSSYHVVGLIFVILTLLTLLSITVLCIVCIRTIKLVALNAMPFNIEVLERMSSYSLDTALQDLQKVALKAFEHNVTMNAKKEKRLTIAYSALSFFIILSVINCIILLLILFFISFHM